MKLNSLKEFPLQDGVDSAGGIVEWITLLESQLGDARPLSLNSFDTCDFDLVPALESLSDERLLVIAGAVAELRPLGPCPGWFFGVDENNSAALVRLRLAIWRACHNRKLQSPIIVPWYDGSQINLYLGNDLSYPTFVGGCIEPNEFAFVDSSLRPGMVFLDIGANEGFYSIFASRRVGNSGRVVAFEPSDREFERLQRNISLNKANNIQAESIALAEAPGRGKLRICEYGHEGQNTLGDFAHDVRQCGDQAVDIQRLDDYLSDHPFDRVDFIKMDVEGAEQRVLEGARQTLARYRPVILLELNDRALRFQGANCQSVVSLLRSDGYAIYSFSPSTGLPFLAVGDETFSSNVIAAPRESSL
jgi:FkbM family methyltransferase